MGGPEESDDTAVGRVLRRGVAEATGEAAGRTAVQRNFPQLANVSVGVVIRPGDGDYAAVCIGMERGCAH